MKWNIEWIDLQKIEQMIAECWRMNERQLEKYCRKLSVQQDLIFAGELGLKFLGLMSRSAEQGVKPDWPGLQKDVRLMKELIQDGQDQREIYWKSQYQELTAHTAAYFGTEFGRVFAEQLAAKLELNMSEEQRMLQHDIRKIQKICSDCEWEDEDKTKKTISLLIQDEKYYFSSWLGDAFINVLQQRYGKKEEEKEESEEQELEIQPEPKAVRRSSLKAKIAWTFIVCVSAGAAVLWLYMQSKDGQLRTKLQNLKTGLVSDSGPDFVLKEEDGGEQTAAGFETEQDVRTGQPDGSEDFQTAGQAGSLQDGMRESDAQAGRSGADDSAELSAADGSHAAALFPNGAAGSRISAKNAAGSSTGQPESSPGQKATAQAGEAGGSLDENTADTGSADGWQENLPDILPQYQAFHKDYPDIFGWLEIPGIGIDHPVMQSDDEKRGEQYFYLHRDYAGNRSEAGSLFVEGKSCCFPQDDNTVIYGHNMSSGLNFGLLEKYKDKSFYKNHQTIRYDTIYETGTYQIAAVLITRILYQEEEGFRYYRFYNYSTEQEFQECRDFVQENQLYDTGQKLRYGDQLLMLSTCEYSRPNGRLVIVARRVE